LATKTPAAEQLTLLTLTLLNQVGISNSVVSYRIACAQPRKQQAGKLQCWYEALTRKQYDLHLTHVSGLRKKQPGMLNGAVMPMALGTHSRCRCRWKPWPWPCTWALHLTAVPISVPVPGAKATACPASASEGASHG
jgi:hypothetical protein